MKVALSLKMYMENYQIIDERCVGGGGSAGLDLLGLDE